MNAELVEVFQQAMASTTQATLQLMSRAIEEFYIRNGQWPSYAWISTDWEQKPDGGWEAKSKGHCGDEIPRPELHEAPPFVMYDLRKLNPLNIEEA